MPVHTIRDSQRAGLPDEFDLVSAGPHHVELYALTNGGERIEEMPLYLVENQPYIHYRKGSVVMYALRDSVGEDRDRPVSHVHHLPGGAGLPEVDRGDGHPSATTRRSPASALRSLRDALASSACSRYAMRSTTQSTQAV